MQSMPGSKKQRKKPSDWTPPKPMGEVQESFHQGFEMLIALNRVLVKQEAIEGQAGQRALKRALRVATRSLRRAGESDTRILTRTLFRRIKSRSGCRRAPEDIHMHEGIEEAIEEASK